MPAVAWFPVALAAIVIIAITVNRARGVKASYIEDWRPEPGEERRFDDPAADVYVVPRLGQARVMSFARRGRFHVVVTDRRIVVAARAFMSRRHMIVHVVHLGAEAGDADLGRLTAGQFHSGFTSYLARPEAMAVLDDGGRRYLRITPEPTASAANVEHIRLYSDHAAHIAAVAAG